MRRFVAVIGVLGTAVGPLGLLAYFTGTSNKYLVLLASFVPMLLLAAVVGAVLLAAVRQWVLFFVAVVVIVTGASVFVPLYVSDDLRADGPSVIVLQANLKLGFADARSLTDTVRDRSVDILAVEELTDEAVTGLAEAGLDDVLPYRFIAPFTLGGGTGIYSRYPISDPRNLDGYVLGNLVADIDVDGAAPLTFHALHPIPPYPHTQRWITEIESLRGGIVGTLDRPNVIVAGDFNATHSHSRYRDLLNGGLSDAADQVGAGIIPTYPTDMSYPAIVDIDHILTKGAVATSLERTDTAGSDHHGLLAEITLAK